MVIDHLKRVITTDNKVRIGIDTQNGIVRITEPGAKLSKIEIIGIDASSTFAFKLDRENYQLSPYFNRSERNINKGCDAVIFTTFNDKAQILLCELKSFDFKDIDIITKMKNSSLFLDYLNTILSTFYNSDFSVYERKYILFHLQRINRTSMRPKQLITPEHVDGLIVYKAYNYRTIHIGKLINL